MKLIIKIVAPLVVVMGAATAVAVATVPEVTTPYPVVPPNPDVCKVDKLDIEKAQVSHEIAGRQLARVRQAFDEGTASAQDLRNAERAVLLASVEVTASSMPKPPAATRPAST